MNAQDLKWFRSRMVAARWGLLQEGDQERFDALLEHAPCRALWEVFLEEDADPAQGEDRLPDALLENWPRRSAALKGMARALVRQHLERSEASRRELEARGWEARLYTAEDLSGPAERAAARTVRPRPRWWLGGWAGLATAAALMLALLRVPGELPQPGLQSERLLLPVPVTRGDDRVESIRLQEEGRRLELLLALQWRDMDRARIRLLDAGGAQLAEQNLDRPEDGGVEYRRIAYRSETVLQPGRYTLQIVTSGESGSESENRPFEVLP